MKMLNQTRIVACVSAAMLTLVPSLRAQLTKVDIFPTNAPPTASGTYTVGVGGAFTITSDGRPFFPNMDFSQDINNTGDGLTFAYESVTGDFDKRVKITSIAADVSNPGDPWTRGALMVRTSTNHYSTSFQLIAANPETGGQNQVGFTGRALDGQNYTWWGRNLSGVTNALPNQWLRLRRVGDQFTAYVGTNGTDWSLIAQRYQVLPANLLVGPYAASGTIGTIATVNFSSYGNTPVADAIAPVLVSAGTLDKTVVGVRFSEPVRSSTATLIANYSITQVGSPITITGAKMGINGDSVHLSVSGLTNDNFTVKVVGPIQDSAGNTITLIPNPQVAARALNWNHGDIGFIQNPASRPTVGDDPGTVGQAVMISSDENPEIEIIGGGSNQWDPGDFIHYVWRTEPLSGNFDVTVAVSRYDRPANTAGWGNSGLMLRASPYLAGQEYTKDGTKVKHVVNSTYLEASAPGRGSIPLWRTADGGGYGNGNAGFSWQTLIGGVKGYYSDLRAIDASGTIDPQSSPETARYLRIKRVGTDYTFYASWNRTDWALVHGPQSLPTLPDQLLLGFSTMGDTGGGNPPFGGYAGNGHQIDPLDPYNPLVAGGVVQNDSNYEVQRIKVFPNGVSDPLPAALTLIDIRPADGDPNALSGSWTSTGTFSFNMTGGGVGQFRNLPAPQDGTSGGDELSFAFETVTGDFDKQVRITSLTNSYTDINGAAVDTNVLTAPFPVDAWARAGLMARSDTNAYSQCLKIMAANPAGANEVRVMGRGIEAQNYTMFSRSYSGVSNAIPNQYLRMKRVGNNFSFYVSKDGVVWSMIAQSYQEMPSTVYFGPYCSASLSPTDTTGNPDALLSRAVATFTAYNDVDLGDLTGPTLISAGTLDKKTVGVKFSEPVSSTTGTVLANYSLSQGTVTGARIGVGGDSVYLTVSGLTANTFSVTVTNVTDTRGNKIAANSTVEAKATGLQSVDIGYIQTPSPRTPTPGDDPYRVGQAVAVSSDDAAEVEIIGGGSNAWNPGDYIHWLHFTTPINGDFDVAAKLSRYDRPNNTAGWGNSGLMLRAAPYLAGQEYTEEGTKVPMVANTTYMENSAPGRAAIPLFRTDPGAGYGNGNPVAWTTVVGGVKGYFGDLRATDASGTLDPQSSAFSARWLRIKRVGTVYSFLWSYDGINWATDEGSNDLPTLNEPLLLGFSTMTDTGGGNPPFSGYAGNGHTISPTDPLNPAVILGNVQNESNYTVQKVRLYPNAASIGAISATKVGGNISITYSGTLVSSTSLNGPWTVVPKQSSPYVAAPTGARLFYRVIP